MTRFARSVAALISIAAVMFSAASPALACGPYVLSPVFELRTHADLPLRNYLSGRPSIVSGTFNDPYLYVFYRQLNGYRFTDFEQKQIAAAMENEIFYRDGQADPRGTGQTGETDRLDEWIKARSKFVPNSKPIETDKQINSGYSYYRNCLPNSFQTATETLSARAAKYGPSDALSEWLAGQDAVFSNCSEATELPKGLDAASPEWLRKDRDYQIAAALFYRGKLDDARLQFESIANDASSPWRNTARFVVARTLIRQAGFVEGETDDAGATKTRNELYKSATDKLEAIIKDPTMSGFRGSAVRLLGLVKYRSIPDERRKELAAILVQSSENRNIYNDLTDYSWLNNRVSSDAETRGMKIEEEEATKAGKEYSWNYDLKLRDVPETDRSDDLTDWIFSYRAADGYPHSFKRWKESAKLHWFVAAITAATSGSGAETDELLNEASRVGPESPAFATVRFHQIRLLLLKGDRVQAKSLLDNTLSRLTTLPRSSENRFLEQRTTLATNLGEFLKFAQRRAVIFDWGEDGREEGASTDEEGAARTWKDRAMFDTDAVAFLNEKIPLSVLREAALSNEVPAYLRKLLTTAVWTRAYVLGDAKVLAEFGPLVAKQSPEFEQYVAKYVAARTVANKEAAALLAILRYPTIQPYVPVGFGREDSQATSIDSIRGNWWCAENESHGRDSAYDTYGFNYPDSYPDFLTAAQKSAAAREAKQIVDLGNGATMLARRAVEFANANPRHPLTPEILHFAVRSTRYGCTDAQTGKYSKAAFDLLHKRYPRSSWTDETPYWFGDN